MDIKAPRYINSESTIIDCIIEHPKFGWIPTTVDLTNDDRPELVDQLSKLSIAAFVPVLIPLSVTKEESQFKIKEFATQCRAKVTGKPDQYKIAGWSSKAQRALRVLNDAPQGNDISILQAECDKRGENETLIELATKHTQKAEKLAVAISVIDGLESKALKALATKSSENLVSQLLDDLEKEAQIELEKLI